SKPVIITTPTERDCTPLLSLHLASPSTFPELLLAMYTGSYARWRRAVKRDGEAAERDAERLRIVVPNTKSCEVGEESESDNDEDEDEEDEDDDDDVVDEDGEDDVGEEGL
ncbi:hypothetical protein HDU85_006434, partial [Gaertneriomyces sp. JEL0708]